MKVLHGVKNFIIRQSNQTNTLTIKHPIFSAIAILVLFYIFDSYATQNVTTIGNEIYTVIILLMLYTFFVTYVRTTLQSEDITDKARQRHIYAFTAMVVVSLTLVFFYEPIIGTILPSLIEQYNQAQILLWLLITPIVEELVFRYLLYDRWALQRMKKPIAILVVAIMFVAVHPVTDFDTFIMHFLPALLLFMVYDVAVFMRPLRPI